MAEVAEYRGRFWKVVLRAVDGEHVVGVEAVDADFAYSKPYFDSNPASACEHLLFLRAATALQDALNAGLYREWFQPHHRHGWTEPSTN